MQLAYLGVTHHSAPVTVRERFALTAAEMTALLTTLTQPLGPEPAALAEAAVVSTCNRFEVYALAGGSEELAGCLTAALAGLRGEPPSQFEPYLAHARGEAVVRHLFRVAAGLDSMILGEPQVLGQVAESFALGQACGATGPVLSALFRAAVHCGKRARSETAIGEHAVSVSHAAVELAKHIFGSLGDCRVLLIGAGEMAELAARNLSDNGAREVLVANRSRERAGALADQFGGTAYGWDKLDQALARADIVICSAGAPHAVVRAETVRPAMACRHKPLFLIDIAVPRNVDPAVGRMANVYLYNIDDLQTVVQGNLAQRQREVPRVEAIVEQCCAEYMAWFHGLDVTSTIRDLHSAAERLRDQEIERALRRLGPYTEHQERVVRTLAQNIVSKLLHSPTIRLKQMAKEGNGHQPAGLLRELFDLSGACEGESHD